MTKPPERPEHKAVQAAFTKTDDEPTSYTLVGNSANSPESLLRLSPATGRDADMLEV
jgi:hypothetical protein